MALRQRQDKVVAVESFHIEPVDPLCGVATKPTAVAMQQNRLTSRSISVNSCLCNAAIKKNGFKALLSSVLPASLPIRLVPILFLFTIRIFQIIIERIFHVYNARTIPRRPQSSY
jgi:hypothetical protein